MQPDYGTNLTLGLGLINTTLRIAIDCDSTNLWFEPDSSGVGVSWQGFAAWDFADMQSRIGLQYEVITELPEPKRNLHSRMLALMKGEADISIAYWGVNYKRSKLIDFSYPDFYVNVHIISGISNDFVYADLIMGIFDDMSYGFGFTSLLAMTLVTWVINAREDRSRSSFVKCLIYMIGNAFNQPLNPSIVPKALFGRTITAIFSMHNYIICLMYGSQIISLLISGSQPPQIDSLDDLNKTGNKNIRIIMREKGYVHEFMKGANMLNGLENRIDYMDTHGDHNQTLQLLESVLQGSHVYLSASIYGMLCKANWKANTTLGNLDDFKKSREVH